MVKTFLAQCSQDKTYIYVNENECLTVALMLEILNQNKTFLGVESFEIEKLNDFSL